MLPEPSADASTLQAELSAYLDGELDAAACSRIEDLIAVDAAVRDELHRLERTWRLLDELPRTEVDELFTQTTVGMVALAASQELEQERAAAPRRRLRQRLAAGAIGLAAACGGFLLVQSAWPNPNEQLVRDLAVLENLDEYRQARDIEFLRLLAQEGVFDPEESDAP